MPRPIQPGGPKILVGGGGEQRTLRIAAKYADMTHWFALGLDSLKHKAEVLERYCEEIGRDPSTIERTAGAPVIVTENEAAGRHSSSASRAERRPFVNVGRPEQMAEAMRPYIEAGFTGFTFNNNLYRTPEQITRVGELLQLVAGEGAGRGALAGRDHRVATRADLNRIALALPETTGDESGTSYKVAGKTIAWPWLERVDPKRTRVPNSDVIAVRVADDSEKEILIEMDPSVFFTEPHYDGYPAILVRLPAIDVATLETILRGAWRCQAPKALLKATGDGDLPGA